MQQEYDGIWMIDLRSCIFEYGDTDKLVRCQVVNMNILQNSN